MPAFMSFSAIKCMRYNLIKEISRKFVCRKRYILTSGKKVSIFSKFMPESFKAFSSLFLNLLNVHHLRKGICVGAGPGIRKAARTLSLICAPQFIFFIVVRTEKCSACLWFRDMTLYLQRIVILGPLLVFVNRAIV